MTSSWMHCICSEGILFSMMIIRYSGQGGCRRYSNCRGLARVCINHLRIRDKQRLQIDTNCHEII